MLRLEPRAQPSVVWRYASPVLALGITVLIGVLLFVVLKFPDFLLQDYKLNHHLYNLHLFLHLFHLHTLFLLKYQ